MNPSMMLVSKDYNRLIALSVALHGKRFDVSLIHAREPLAEAAAAPIGTTTMMIALEGAENVVEIRQLFERMPQTRCLFLLPGMPPSAAIARIVRDHGGAILSGDEPDVVIIATLIAMSYEPRSLSAGLG